MLQEVPKTVYLDDKTYNVVNVKQGGMGRVWLLENSFDHGISPIYRSRLAVKTFDFVPDHYLVEQELNSWVSLEHRNILPLLRIGRLNYRVAAIMPWLKGTLDDEMATRFTFPEDKAVELALQISAALHYAYEKYKIVHLDLKPANILIFSGEPLHFQVSDWGISRIASKIIHSNWSGEDLGNQYTAYGAGTPLYMSPERFSGKWKISPQADMYSLGMILVRSITGTLPFCLEEKNPYHEIVQGIYVENTGRILNTKSKNLKRIIYSCIHPDERMRPKSYRHLIKDLKRC